MSLEKAKIEDCIYDVISLDEFDRSPDSYKPNQTAVKGNDGLIYPIRSRTDIRPGFYSSECFDFFRTPPLSQTRYYSDDNIINFRNAASLREVIAAKQRLQSEERSILTSIDSVFTPEIQPNDTPEMKALKQAITDKHIDLDKYESRFGPNFNNDKRLLRKNSITFGKLRSICDALDIRVTISIEDSAPDVPNPIGRTIIADITGDNMSLESDDEEE